VHQLVNKKNFDIDSLLSNPQCAWSQIRLQANVLNYTPDVS